MILVLVGIGEIASKWWKWHSWWIPAYGIHIGSHMSDAPCTSCRLVHTLIILSWLVYARVSEGMLVCARAFQGSRTSARRVKWPWNWSLEFLTIHSFARSFARTAHSFACSARLASLVRSAALIHLLAHLLRSSWESGFCQWIECFNPQCNTYVDIKVW